MPSNILGPGACACTESGTGGGGVSQEYVDNADNALSLRIDELVGTVLPELYQFEVNEVPYSLTQSYKSPVILQPANVGIVEINPVQLNFQFTFDRAGGGNNVNYIHFQFLNGATIIGTDIQKMSIDRVLNYQYFNARKFSVNTDLTLTIRVKISDSPDPNDLTAGAGTTNIIKTKVSIFVPERTV